MFSLLFGNFLGSSPIGTIGVDYLRHALEYVNVCKTFKKNILQTRNYIILVVYS